jgi:hypothetical protein
MTFFPIFSIPHNYYSVSFRFFYPQVSFRQASLSSEPVFLHYYTLVGGNEWSLRDIIRLKPYQTHLIDTSDHEPESFGCCVYYRKEHTKLSTYSLPHSDIKARTCLPGALRALFQVTSRIGDVSCGYMAYEYPSLMASYPVGRFVSYQKLVSSKLPCTAFLLLVNLSVDLASTSQAQLYLNRSKSASIDVHSNSVLLLPLNSSSYFSSDSLKFLPIYIFQSSRLSIEHTHPPSEYTIATLRNNQTLQLLRTN